METYLKGGGAAGLSEPDRLALRAFALLGDPLVQAWPAIAAAIALAGSGQLAAGSPEGVMDLVERLCKINSVVREIGPIEVNARAEAAFRRAFPRWK